MEHHRCRTWTFCRSRAAALVILGVFLARPGHAAEPEPSRLSVMTFNLRYASAQSPNAWPDRRPVMVECLRQSAPDLIGTQECLYQQLKDLEQDLPAYASIGLGRDGGSRGEWMAVLYRRQRFEPLEFDHFWLSDTPEVIASTTWGNRNRRMVTWVRFVDRANAREFYFVNTHLDHEVQVAREKAAELIRQRLEPLAAKAPVLLVGDFNATARRNKAYDILVTNGGYTDLWLAADTRRGDLVKTFHNYKGPVPGDDRIDWILARGPVHAEAIEILTCAKNGQYPSDHFPVQAIVRIGPPVAD